MYEELGGDADYVRGSTSPMDAVELSSRQWELLAPWFNRDLYRSPAPRLAHALNPLLDWAQLEREYFAHPWNILAIDEFLAPEALLSLRRYCELSSIWNVVKAKGYLGAYFDYGMHAPLMVQVAEELRSRMPKIFCHHTLTQAWG